MRNRIRLIPMTELERPRLYLETSVISYLAARPSRDLLVAANQQITHEWWSKRRTGFQVFVSRWIVREISVGDPGVSEARVAIIAGLPRLEVTIEAESLAERLIATHALPRSAADDALPVAVATVNEIDFYEPGIAGTDPGGGPPHPRRTCCPLRLRHSSNLRRRQARARTGSGGWRRIHHAKAASSYCSHKLDTPPKGTKSSSGGHRDG